VTDLEADRQQRFVRGFARFALVMALSMAIVDVAVGRPLLALAATLGGAAAMGASALSQAGFHRQAVWTTTILMSLVASVAVFVAGGLAGSATPFLAVVPLYATLAGGFGPGLFAFVVCLGAAVGLGLLGAPPPVDAEFGRVMVSRMFTTALLGGMGVVLVGSTDGLTMELQRARRRAAVASQTKSRLLANCSHDLRTPLNAILGYTELLVDDARRQGHETVVADLEHVERAARRLLTTIDHVLDLARLESGRSPPRPGPTDVVALVRSLDPSAEGVDAMQGRRPQLDGARLTHALTSLAEAGRDGAESGPRLTVHLDAPTGLRITITATGFVLDGARGSVFDPFERLGPVASPDQRETGLELAIARQEIESMGGSVQLEGGGSSHRFRIWIPLAPRGEEEPRPPRARMDVAPPSRGVVASTPYEARPAAGRRSPG